MRNRQFSTRAGRRLAAGAALVIALAGSMGAASAGDRASSEVAIPQRNGAALDTTGISGSRPGCMPRASAASAPGPGDVRPENGVAGIPGAVPRTPRIVEDQTVGGGADTGVGENRSFPRGATGGAKANDC
jgi:hypothetical protein